MIFKELILLLHYPIHVREFDGYWCICPKGLYYNLVFSRAGIPMVYKTKELADKAFEEFKAMRRDIKYMEKIYVNI